MSEIPANHFQFTRRGNTLNVNSAEMPDFNSKIKQISENTGSQFETFKDLFVFLLDFAISQDSIQELSENEMIVEKIEFDLLKSSQQTIISQNETLHQQLTDVQTAKDELADRLKSLEDQAFEKELQISQAMENVLLVPCLPEQKELLEGIALNRLNEGYGTEVPGTPDSPGSILKQIAFRDSYLFNHYGRFYTGL